KHAEFEVLDSGAAKLGRDSPESGFFAETVPRTEWDKAGDPRLAAVDKLVLVHRLREVIALVGFTRFEAASPDKDGELDLNVTPAALDEPTTWLPAIEHRGEGVFISINPKAVTAWLDRPAVKERARALMEGFKAWDAEYGGGKHVFPGVPYYMLHSLAHMLIT